MQRPVGVSRKMIEILFPQRWHDKIPKPKIPKPKTPKPKIPKVPKYPKSQNIQGQNT